LSTEDKRKILISPEQQKSQVGTYFQELGFELTNEFVPGDEASYSFAVDQYFAEAHIPRVYTKNQDQFKADGTAVSFFDQSFLTEDSVKYLLRAGFSKEADFDLIGHYSADFKNLFSVRIQDYLNVGYFIDLIIVDAYKNKFPINEIRDYLNLSFNYVFELLEINKELTSIDVTYSYTSNGFALEMIMSAPSFSLEHGNPVYSKLSEKTNCFSLNFYKKRKRLQLSSLWFKSVGLRDFRSCFLSETVGKIHRAEFNPDTHNRLDENGDEVSYDPSFSSFENTSELYFARQIYLFIKRERSKEENPIPASEIQIKHIDRYLELHPRKGCATKISNEAKLVIIKLLQDDAINQGVEDYIDGLTSLGLETIIDDVQRVLGQKSIDDVKDIMRVAGGAEEAGDDYTIVNGWALEYDDESWTTKRNALVEAIKKEFSAIKSEGRNFVEEDLVNVVAGNLLVDADEVRPVVRALIEEVAASKMIQKDKSTTEGGYELSLSPRLFNSELEGAQIQIIKLSKVIQKMRVELGNLLQENRELKKKRASEEMENENLTLKVALGKAMEAVRSKEEFYLSSKIKFEQAIEVKDQNIKKLEQKLELLKDRILKSKQAANEERLEQLTIENKNLSVKLEIAQNKLNIISENMDKQRTNDSSKRESLIKHFSAEKVILEEKLRQATLELKKAEYKNKNLSSQIESNALGKTTLTAQEKTNDYYMRQIEGLNGRIAEAGNELTEKKKEMLKLKQENSALGAKVSELERKVANLEKKAA
jgi:hypothetical protein